MDIPVENMKIVIFGPFLGPEMRGRNLGVYLLIFLAWQSPAVCRGEDEYQNETAYSNETSPTNASAYRCLGASKEEMKLYGILAWWMDAVCLVTFYFFNLKYLCINCILLF
jgi:hypothetical protein